MKKVYAVAFGVASFFALNCGSGDEGSGYPEPSSGGTTSAPPASSGTATDSNGTAPAAAEVKVLGHDFAPQEVHVKKGQAVRWVWVIGSHNVVSGASCTPDGKFDSGGTQSKGTFEHTFDATGTYPYYCDPHCGVGMTGKVIVDE